MEYFAEARPDVEIEVQPSGLVTGAKIKPYSEMYTYIKEAAPRMTAITGQALEEPFFEMMRQAETPLSISAPPSHAILQMKALVDDRSVLRFVHKLQAVHFKEGKDLNLPKTYDAVTDALSLPRLETAAIAAATETDPQVAASFNAARNLGVSSFPTCLVIGEDGQKLGRISGVYEPDDFIAQFDQLRH